MPSSHSQCPGSRGVKTRASPRPSRKHHNPRVAVLYSAKGSIPLSDEKRDSLAAFHEVSLKDLSQSAIQGVTSARDLPEKISGENALATATWSSLASRRLPEVSSEEQNTSGEDRSDSKKASAEVAPESESRDVIAMTAAPKF